ncbi:hypothetical protein CR513_16612, partial [Mucuna pruriens]
MRLSIIVLVLIHPHQNEIVERKNKHLLEVARVLLFSTKCFPMACISTYLPIKTFGCTTFVHEHKELGKLEPCTIKCVFIGYLKDINETLKVSKRKEAIIKDMRALEKNHT